MKKIEENNGTEEIGLVTPTPDQDFVSSLLQLTKLHIKSHITFLNHAIYDQIRALNNLTHWGLVTHICVIIGSNTDFSWIRP